MSDEEIPSQVQQDREDEDSDDDELPTPPSYPSALSVQRPKQNKRSFSFGDSHSMVKELNDIK